MPKSRRRMFHTCTGVALFTVCNTLRAIVSPTVQDRLRRPHNNIRPHFSSPSPCVLSSFCQTSLFYRKLSVLGDARTCAPLVTRRTADASDEGYRQPSRAEPELPSLRAGDRDEQQFHVVEMMRSLTSRQWNRPNLEITSALRAKPHTCACEFESADLEGVAHLARSA